MKIADLLMWLWNVLRHFGQKAVHSSPDPACKLPKQSRHSYSASLPQSEHCRGAASWILLRFEMQIVILLNTYNFQLCLWHQEPAMAISLDTSCSSFRNEAFEWWNKKEPPLVLYPMSESFAQTIVAHSVMLTSHPSPQRVGKNKNLAPSLATKKKKKTCKLFSIKIYAIMSTISTFRNGSTRIICESKLFRNSSGSFSSQVRPLTELSWSRSSRSFITRSDRTKTFFRNGLTISSRRTFWTSL